MKNIIPYNLFESFNEKDLISNIVNTTKQFHYNVMDYFNENFIIESYGIMIEFEPDLYLDIEPISEFEQFINYIQFRDKLQYNLSLKRLNNSQIHVNIKNKMLTIILMFGLNFDEKEFTFKIEVSKNNKYLLTSNQYELETFLNKNKINDFLFKINEKEFTNNVDILNNFIYARNEFELFCKQFKSSDNLNKIIQSKRKVGGDTLSIMLDNDNFYETKYLENNSINAKKYANISKIDAYFYFVKEEKIFSLNINTLFNNEEMHFNKLYVYLKEYDLRYNNLLSANTSKHHNASLHINVNNINVYKDSTYIYNSINPMIDYILNDI